MDRIAQSELTHNTVVIGDRVSGPPVVTCSVPLQQAEQQFKSETVAYGMPHEGIVQPITTAEHVKVAPAMNAHKRAVEQTLLTRKTRPKRAVPASFEVGSRVSTRGTTDGLPKRFFGTITQRVSGGWLVSFDDGDEETQPAHSLKLEMDTEQSMEVADRPVQQLAEMVGFAGEEDQGAVTSTAAAAEHDTIAEGPDPEQQQLEMLPEPIRAKLEYMEKAPTSSKDASTLAQEALRAKLQTTPDGRPRAVFRAGCHARCLTQVLGGVGTDDLRIVKEDHILPDGHVFIRKGEFYLWGLADWNPWAPSFAGDTGMYMFWDLAAELKKTCQKSFHLFRHCTDDKRKMPPSAWHGEDAAKKALYLGMYTVDDACTQEMRYNDLAPVYTATQDLMCEYELKRGRYGSSIEQIRRDFECVNTTFTMQCVVPVGYDERLYSELVRTGANNGVVATDVYELGRL